MASSASSVVSSFSSLSLRRSSVSWNPRPAFSTVGLKPTRLPTRHRPLLTPTRAPATRLLASSDDGTDTSLFDNVNADEEIPYDAPVPPEGYVSDPLDFDDLLSTETDEEADAAYEEIYGPAYSGETYLGNDIYIMDAELKKDVEIAPETEKTEDGFEERVVEVRRVTRVVKGGKQLNFRAVVVVGDKQGKVGVGVGKAKEVVSAVQKSVANAKKNLINVPITKYSTFPHRADGNYGAAKVMLRPAAPGSGVIAGGAVRVVLELAGVENALGKQLGSDNPLNNARATVVAIQTMRQFSEVALERGIPMEELWK